MSDINNRLIAKNTIFLYIRTIIILIIALYTSRLILHTLGETDLGIYNVVGGIVTLITFLQAAQTKSTGRFITYDLGQGSIKAAANTFSICFTIHIIIAIVAIILAETIGFWIINNWTEIPDDRIFAANIVYQFSILTFVFHFIRVPLDATVIAHEKMSIFAYFSILEILLQLGAVISLTLIQGDKLILFGFLYCCAAIIVFLAYLIYLSKKLSEYKIRWNWDKEKSINILKFSGWNLLGGASNIATQQGVSLLFNNFVGLVANTALGFANQVNGAVGKFVSSFTTAFNPQVTKLYAQNELNSMHTLMTRSAKFSFALCFIMTLPLIVNMEYILSLWLGNVPKYTTEFCQLILICTTIDATTSILNTAITATGKIKNYQIGISISFILDLIVSFILLLIEIHPAIVFASRIATRGIINMFIGMYFGNRYVKYSYWVYTKRVLFPALCVILFSAPFTIYVHSLSALGWNALLYSLFVSLILTILGTLIFIMTKSERMKLFLFIKNKIHG